jgi:hypothetical protein
MSIVTDFKSINRILSRQEQKAEFEEKNPEPAMYGWPYGAMVPFAIVHQGGHHTVWCDGKVHKRSSGGYAACYDQAEVLAPRSFSSEFACDCQRWKRQ